MRSRINQINQSLSIFIILFVNKQYRIYNLNQIERPRNAIVVEWLGGICGRSYRIVPPATTTSRETHVFKATYVICSITLIL